MLSRFFKVANQKMLLFAIVIVSSVSAIKDSFKLYNSSDRGGSISTLRFESDAVDENKFTISGILECGDNFSNCEGYLHFERLNSATDLGRSSDSISTRVENQTAFIDVSDGLKIDMSEYSGYTYFRVFYILDKPYLGYKERLDFPVLEYNPDNARPFSIYDANSKKSSKQYKKKTHRGYSKKFLTSWAIVISIAIVSCIIGCGIYYTKKTKRKSRTIITEDQIYDY